MLIAEYRELPRIRTLLVNRMKAHKPIPEMETFCLNQGHMLYFLNKGQYLMERWSDLCTEMEHRNLAVNLRWRRWPYLYEGQLLQENIPEEEQVRARKILQERINQRLKEMKRKPIWTNRQKPDWVEV